MIQLFDTLKYHVEALGHRPGTVEYDKALVALRVDTCRELNKLPYCSGCPKYTECELVQLHLRNDAGL